MTIETKTTLELKDIKGIEFECESCHARVFYPIDKYRQPPTRCTACENSPQWLVAGGTDWEDLQRFAQIIQRLSKGSQHFKVRLEVSNLK